MHSMPMQRVLTCWMCYSLAWAELYLLILSIVLRFELKMDGAGRKDWVPYEDQFTIGTEDQSGIKTWISHYEERAR